MDITWQEIYLYAIMFLVCSWVLALFISTFNVRVSDKISNWVTVVGLICCAIGAGIVYLNYLMR